MDKHGVDFVDAVGVFDDPRALTMPDPHPGATVRDAGARFVGASARSSWTQRGGDIRLISARKATRRERRQHEEIGARLLAAETQIR
jgi:uncharacterized DUF497 family protein